jgi:large subunit ribosomal protein L10
LLPVHPADGSLYLAVCKVKTFFILKEEGGEKLVAVSKQHNNVLLGTYEEWLDKSQAVYVIEYKKMSMKEADAMRRKVRDAGGELHVVKNTLMDLALNNCDTKHEPLIGTCLMGFAYNDVPALAKVFLDLVKNSEVFKLKGGYMDGRQISADEIKMLAELPPLPVMRAKLLGLLQAPAGKLVRTINEPGRSLAYVFNVYAQQGQETAAVAA